VKFLRWFWNGRECPRCHEYTGYHFWPDCDVCQAIDLIGKVMLNREIHD
jgi:hypothetical protein